MASIADGNTAALRQHEARQARGEQFMDQAQAERRQLVADYIADERSKNETDLLDYLGDLAGGDSEFLHALQRGDVARMQKLFHDKIDHAMGDDLVDKRASEIENHVPCRCRGDCTC